MYCITYITTNGERLRFPRRGNIPNPIIRESEKPWLAGYIIRTEENACKAHFKAHAPCMKTQIENALKSAQIDSWLFIEGLFTGDRCGIPDAAYYAALNAIGKAEQSGNAVAHHHAYEACMTAIMTGSVAAVIAECERRVAARAARHAEISSRLGAKAVWEGRD